MKNSFIAKLTAALIVLPVVVMANHKNPENVAKRAAPVGQVYRAGDIIEKAAPMVTAEIATGPRSAETIYKKCSVCHDSGAANAPIVGNLELWAPRISKGLEALISSAINGTAGGMPPKGMCMDCSDDEIKATVEFMVEKSQ